MSQAKSNPYSIGEPAEGLFYGRQDQVEKLATALTAPVAVSYAMVGGRRFGKTSLLYAIKRHLLDALSYPSDGEYCVIPVYINLLGDKIEELTGFFSLVIDSLHHQLSEYPTGLAPSDWSELLPFDSNRPAHHAFADKLVNLCQNMTSKGNPGRAVLLLDEIEEILDRPWRHDLFNQIRWLISENPGTRSYLKVILSGSNHFYNYMKQKSSPLCDVLEPEYLAAFPESETLRLIQEPCNEQVPEEVAHEILYYSGGHPYLVQYFMHHLWPVPPSKASPQQVQELAELFMGKYWSRLEGWRESVGELGCRAYAILSSRNDWMEVATIRQAIGGETPGFVPALIALCYHGLAIHDNWQYYLAVGGLFREWFVTNVSSDVRSNKRQQFEAPLEAKESKPTVFISYSHKDEEWKDLLVTHLGVLYHQDLLDLWNDRRIGAGEDWYQEIQEAMATASVAILLVSANFLTSQFILGEEVPRLLERRDKEGLRIFPIIVKPCAWQTVGWLSRMQARPQDGRPLSAGDEYQIDADLAAIAEEVAAIIDRAARVVTSEGFASIDPEMSTSVHRKEQVSKLPQILLDFASAEQLREVREGGRKVFLAHEYGEPWLERLYKELRPFLSSQNHVVLHPLDAAPGGTLWRRIATMIEEADLGFYDITTMNGNVCFELGYSIGARKPYFALVDTGSIDRENVPRILEGNWWVTYQAEADLREQVTRILGSPLDNLGFFYESTEPIDSEAGTALLMVANEARQRSDIQPVLQRVLRGMGWRVDTIPIEKKRDISRLHRRILEREIIIGDLASDDRSGSRYANAELALALGIACGAKKKPVILQEETCKILSDMKTLVREFRGKEEAKKALREEL